MNAFGRLEKMPKKTSGGAMSIKVKVGKRG